MYVMFDVKDFDELIPVFRDLGNAVHDVMADITRSASPEVISLFELTTKTWDHHVSFFSDIRTVGGDVVGTFGTTDPIWNMVNLGTRRHPIRPVRATVLVFQSQYRAKTIPGQLASVSGGASGDTVFARSVDHPGFSGRYFTREIQDIMGDTYLDMMWEGWRRALARLLRGRL